MLISLSFLKYLLQRLLRILKEHLKGSFTEFRSSHFQIFHLPPNEIFMKKKMLYVTYIINYEKSRIKDPPKSQN